MNRNELFAVIMSLAILALPAGLFLNRSEAQGKPNPKPLEAPDRINVPGFGIYPRASRLTLLLRSGKEVSGSLASADGDRMQLTGKGRVATVRLVAIDTIWRFAK